MVAIPLLQCRLAKDGSDQDLQKAFQDEEIRKANVDNRSERIKILLRLGLQYEQIRLLETTTPYNRAVQDAALNRQDVIHAKIGTDEFMLVI